MTYEEVLENAKKTMALKCKVCPECNGIACKGQVPGAGGVKSGRAFTVCRDFLKSVYVNMDTIHEEKKIDTSIEFLGHKFDVPFFIAPIGGMAFNYTNYLDESEYSKAVVFGARACNTLAFTGDGPDDSFFSATLPIIKEADGIAISTIKPWEYDKVMHNVRKLEECGAIGFAMDVDSAALVNLKLMGKPVTTKSVDEYKKITSATKLPLIIKGIMTAKSALKCADAGAYGIIVSTHGGRVLEDTPAPCSVVPEIREAVGDRIRILVDGGIRSGSDVFKAIALGADGVLIGRPYAIAAHGGKQEGVEIYTRKIADELREIMMMTDCASLKDITRDKIRF